MSATTVEALETKINEIEAEMKNMEAEMKNIGAKLEEKLEGIMTFLRGNLNVA